MEFLGNIIGAGAGGGILGVVGSVFGAVGQYFARKQEMQEAVFERAHELKLMEFEMQQSKVETENELAILQSQADAISKEKSYGLKNTSRHASTWVNNLRSLFRPFLTVALWGLTLTVLLIIMKSPGLFSSYEINEILKYVVYSIVFSATTATVWWFGDRALQPPGQKKR